MSDEQRAFNTYIAKLLGYSVRVANANPWDTAMPFGCWELVNPDGQIEMCFCLDGTRFAEFYTPDEAWELAPDFMILSHTHKGAP